jgi:hypothetical protein
MIKHILAVGDSFTYGEELENRDNAYPYYLAKGLKADVVNLGQPGGGNRQMIRKVIDYVLSGDPLDLVIIGWTSPGRMEFADATGIFDIWPGYSGDLFRRENQTWRLELLGYINKYHDPKYIYTSFLHDVIMMQSFLKERGIKYLMLRVVGNEYYHNAYYNDDAELPKQIDSKYFIGWPNEGMAEWTNSCKRGPRGHFLEEGHRKVTAKIYEHIRHLGWLS